MALGRLPHVVCRRHGRHDADRFHGDDRRRETAAGIGVEDPERTVDSGRFGPMYRHGTDRESPFHLVALTDGLQGAQRAQARRICEVQAANSIGNHLGISLSQRRSLLPWLAIRLFLGVMYDQLECDDFTGRWHRVGRVALTSRGRLRTDTRPR